MYTFFIILVVIASILLTLLVLVQNSKGGGLAAGFTSTNQIMGVRKTTDFLEKATWTLVIALVVFSVAAVGFRSNGVAADESEIRDVYQEAQQNLPSTANPGFGEEAGEQTAEEGQQ
ncbi:MAG: preprotein translocase subunit SecG [Paludibacter sp. 47-17]|nr:MAG: preprotein translocase subunit SecG [Paludibacter sp. SCN 51-9]OJX90764.1 MAG: preprotein translocase subunit SecG [Paludibacter sp. 47-17]